VERLFGTSGIRGLIDVDLTPELSIKIGLAAAKFYGEGARILVGRDHRPHARVIELGLISGLLAGGVNVIEAGVAPTPAILWALLHLDADGAIVCTGSHTPPEIVGILFFKKDTSELDRGEEERFERIMRKESFDRVPWNRVGSLECVDITDIYIESVLRMIKTSIGGRIVVVDPGNGVASGVLRALLERAGVDVVAINDTPDPRFPRRDPFPRPENLKRLGQIVRGIGADLGVATDGDGDRAIFVGEDGSIYWGDISGALLAMDAIKYRNTKDIVVTVNTSSIVEIVVKRLGGRVHYCDVGPPSIAARMKEVNAGFGLEESGKYIWSDAIYYGDVALATIRMLELLEREGKTISELVSELPRRTLTKTAISCPNSIKNQVTEYVYRRIRDIWKEKPCKILRIRNGFKVLYEDGSWVLFRPSGTEPKYRIHAEACDEKIAQKLLERGIRIVRNAIRTLAGLY